MSAISIHPLRGEWDNRYRNSCPSFPISIHPLRGEWDDDLRKKTVADLRISIHPLRGEWDIYSRRRRNHRVDFNPPTPWGMGRRHRGSPCCFLLISIHPLRGEWDSGVIARQRHTRHFNPPTPWGVGHRMGKGAYPCWHFNPPTPWGVGPRQKSELSTTRPFQSTHSVGSGTDIAVDEKVLAVEFQSTHSVGSGTLKAR